MIHSFSRAGALVLMAAACVLAAAILPAAAAQAGARAGDGAETPGLELASLAGSDRSLLRLRGSVVVLNFWATWCIPCREEMPVLVDIKKDYRLRGVEVVAASADEERKLKAVRRFSRKYKLNFPVWVGATIPDMQRFGLGDQLPATAILDREGRIAFRILGPVTREELEARLDHLLEPGAGAAPVAILDTFGRHAESPRSNAAGSHPPASDEPRSAAVEHGSEDDAASEGPDEAPAEVDAHAEEEAGHDHHHEAGESHHHGGTGEDASQVPS